MSINNLTSQQIIDEAARLAAMSQSFGTTINAVIQGMFSLGLRVKEAIDKSRWSINMAGQYVLITCKGSETRTFEVSEIPVDFANYLNAGNGLSEGISYSSVERWLLENGAYKNLYCEGKGISCHIFRYAKILSLKQMGWTDVQIQNYIGHRSISSTEGYLSNTLYY